MAHLHPRRLGGIESRVECHRVLLMWRQGTTNVYDGHLQRGGHAEPAAGRARLGRGRAPANAQVGPSHVRVDERGQVTRMDAVLEILAVHSGQIVVPFFRALRIYKCMWRMEHNRCTQQDIGNNRTLETFRNNDLSWI